MGSIFKLQKSAFGQSMNYIEIFITALKLGLTSFGGPVAHLSFFHQEYVVKKKWMTEQDYADLVALCQFLPGPASSQVGMAIGFNRAGFFGALLSWFGFTLPSAFILILFGLGINNFEGVLNSHWIHGLKIVAVAIVAQAVYTMGKKLCTDKERVAIAFISCIIILFTNSVSIQIFILLIAGLIGVFFLNSSSDEFFSEKSLRINSWTSVILISTFIGLLFLLPLIRSIYPNQALNIFDSFYRAGALVFGGGHVVLPLLQNEVVPSGWVSNDLFIAGYGVANAIPGPLFAFSAYLGAVSKVPPNGWFGAMVGLIAVFLPSFLLIIGVIPYWEKLKNFTKVRKSMMGLNAAVVGILLAAFFNPVWVGAIFSIKDFMLALVGFLLLEFLKVSSWKVVIITLGLSFIIY